MSRRSSLRNLGKFYTQDLFTPLSASPALCAEQSHVFFGELPLARQLRAQENIVETDCSLWLALTTIDASLDSDVMYPLAL